MPPKSETFSMKTITSELDFLKKKSDIIEQPKASHKLSKTIRKGDKKDSNNSLYSDTQKVQIF